MLQQFFILCSGADRTLLSTCSPGEQTKYAGIGATVFFTALMASLAAGYALFTVFDAIIPALVFGILWGLLIFNLDRFIVSTLRKRDSFRHELLQASPRLALALIIAVVISKPLELKIFEKEINTVLLKEKNAMAMANKTQIAGYYEKDILMHEAKADSLRREINRKETAAAALYDAAITEAEGTAGTKRMGKGPIYKEKAAAYALAKSEIDSLKKSHATQIADSEQAAANVRETLNQKVAASQPIIDGFDGLMARINALNALPLLPSLFIMLLFFAIETSPIIAKMLAPRGEYDIRLDDQETALQASLEQDKYQRDLLVKTNAEMHDRVYADIASDSELYDIQRRNSRELLELQSNGFVDKQRATLKNS